MASSVVKSVRNGVVCSGVRLVYSDGIERVLSYLSPTVLLHVHSASALLRPTPSPQAMANVTMTRTMCRLVNYGSFDTCSSYPGTTPPLVVRSTRHQITAKCPTVYVPAATPKHLQTGKVPSAHHDQARKREPPSFKRRPMEPCRESASRAAPCPGILRRGRAACRRPERGAG